MTRKSTKNTALHTEPKTGANDPQVRPGPIRETDPNVLQSRASTPETSVWVSASAGTGKTKVLTDRVLRLLLPGKNGAPASPAHKILCLTFTKAAASEMALRINETLSRWAVMPETDLEETLRKLLGRPAGKEEIENARRLFADVTDTPGGLKIMTIHAFCQSVLGRFPLEAGINPHFEVLEDTQSRALMNAARMQALAKTQNAQASPLAEALSRIAATINEDQFLALLDNIAGERSQLKRLLSRHFGPDGLYTALCAELGVTPGQTAQTILSDACKDSAFEKTALREAAGTMAASGAKTDSAAAQNILNWLEAPEEQRPGKFSDYTAAFFKKDGEIRAKLATQKSVANHPEILDILAREAHRLLGIKETLNAAEITHLTRDILILGQAVLEEYTALKKARGAMDFDDLILHTLSLLDGSSMNLPAEKTGSWVHFKLDEGLDHILIDEAQDTNPEQWQIIEALCEEFFAHNPDRDTQRTVFTVGDEKQSIYSFQRASPEEFARMQNHFKIKTENARQNWDAVPMNISFRSTSGVLKAVDAVFASPAARKGLGELPVIHTAFRRGQAGHVELWPPFESDNAEPPDLWTPVKETAQNQSGRKKLSLHIAQTIKTWLDSGEILESKNRPLRPGDIMILVRTRSALVNEIARQLKNLSIPVSGLDRMVLSEELAVQDILAAAEFTLQPLDNLTLASLLKSPFIGLSEDLLYELAAGRSGQSLWERLRERGPEDIKNWLTALQTSAKTKSPFDFFNHLLQSPCPADPLSARRAITGRLGKDALDPLDELLTLARNFQQTRPASLQSFIHLQRTDAQEIKRPAHGETTEETGEIQIMTVHGSKGLQAPVVILPDTVSSAAQAPTRPEKRLLWPGQTGLNIPLWSPRKDLSCDTYAKAASTVEERLNEEYRRLLYVAMTRAEDRLYIGGALSKKQKPETLPEDCWYRLIQKGLQSLEDTQETESGALTLSNPQTREPDGKPESPQTPQQNTAIPQYLYQPAPPESQETKTFRPSQINDAALSPLKNAGTHRFVRGNLTHRLLQLLPELPEENRETAAVRFLKRYAAELPPQIHTDIVKETLNILNNRDFAPLFGPGSMAEIPLTGHIEGKERVSAQIDRLCITEKTIWIIDYKTNRPPPKTANQIPQIYRRQMETYAALLKQIYPDRTLKAALLWTDGPFLMPLDL
ncbi:MAG: double-strand break repair helicase AddA [Alphaproteobacteria bacterium]